LNDFLRKTSINKMTTIENNKKISGKANTMSMCQIEINFVQCYSSFKSII